MSIGGGSTVQFTVSLGSVIAVLGMVTTGFFGWWRGSAGMRRLVVQVAHVMEDWNGSPGRPGVPERPGMMVRMATMEQKQTEIAGQLTTNGGSSLRDVVKRVEQSQSVIETRLAELTAQGRLAIASGMAQNGPNDGTRSSLAA